MKKTIVLIFIISTFFSFGQENEYNKKHNLLFDIGINHTSNFKPVYHPAYKTRLLYPPPETLYPGHYSLPAFNYQTNFIYRFYFYKGFNINAKINISYLKETRTRSIDSINKYYVYSDSVINILPYDFLGVPSYSKLKKLKIGLNFALAYRYKRLSVMTGIMIPISEYAKYYSEYKNGLKIKNNYNLKFSDIHFGGIEYLLNTRIEFIILKKKIPISIYFETTDLIFGGIVINTSYLKLK